MNINIDSRWLATIAVIGFCFYAIPASDGASSYSQGRVWAVSGLLALFLVLRAQKIKDSIRDIFTGPLKVINFIALLWLFTVIISNLRAPNIEIAFLGSYWGQFGVHQITLCLVIFFIAQSIKLGHHQWRAIGFFYLILILIAALESLGLRPLTWLPDSQPYPSVTIGQRGHLAGLFAVAFGVAAYKKSYIFSMASIIGVALCNNTSAMIAIIATIILSSIFRRRLDLRSTTLLAACIASFYLIPHINKFICTAAQHPNCTETKQIAKDDASSASVRLIFWKSSMDMFLEKPLLGWGDEQYDQHWLSYLSDDEQRKIILSLGNLEDDAIVSGEYPLYYYTRPASKDHKKGNDFGFFRISNIHPHNTYLEELQNHGILGFLLLSSAAFCAIRRNKRIIIFALPYMIYLFSWFCIISVTPVFLFFLGMLISDKNSELKGLKNE